MQLANRNEQVVKERDSLSQALHDLGTKVLPIA